MSANSNWLPARKMRVLLGGVAQKVQDGEYGETAGKFDATNTEGDSNAQGLLAEEHGVDTIATALRFTLVVDGNALPSIKTGALLPGTSYVDASGAANTGSFRILKKGQAIATRGGWKISVEGEFTGLVSGQ